MSSGVGLWRWALALLAPAVTAAVPALAQPRNQRLQTPEIGTVTMDRFLELLFRPETGYFRSPSPLRIVLEDARTGEKTTLLADDAEGTVAGDILVRGAVRIEEARGFLSGRNLHYDARTETGSILEARANLSGLFVTGEKIELVPGRIIRATNATFTTCIKERPDYRITAREIVANPDRKKVRARHVTFYIGSTRIISLPSLERSFRRSQGSPVPLPGYSSDSGLTMQFRSALIDDPAQTLDYNIALSLKRPPEGTVSYARDLARRDEDSAPPRSRSLTAALPMRSALEISPPPNLRLATDTPETARRITAFALLAVNQFVYHRLRTDLLVSRMPEAGVSFSNLTGRSEQETEAPGILGALPRGALHDPRQWLVNAEIAAGQYSEQPTGGRSSRLSARADASSPLVPFGANLFLRVGFTAWASRYGVGGSYFLAAPEVEANFLPRPSTLLSAALRHQTSTGRTPFAFDSRDIANELTTRYAFFQPTGWVYDIGLHFDLGRGRAYDTTASLRRRTDCIEYGIAYNARSQGFTLVFNLLPARPANPAGGPR